MEHLDTVVPAVRHNDEPLTIYRNAFWEFHLSLEWTMGAKTEQEVAVHTEHLDTVVVAVRHVHTVVRTYRQVMGVI